MNIQTQLNKLKGFERTYKSRNDLVIERLQHNQKIKDIQEEFKHWSDEFDSVLNEVMILRQMRGE